MFASFLLIKLKMSDVVPLLDNGTLVVPPKLNGIKPTRSRCIRKRKFTASELAKSDMFVSPVKESDLEGPFWFEKSSTTYVDGEKIHHGITRREHQLLKEIVKSGFFTNERLRDIVVPLNDESSTTPRLRAFDWAVTNFSKGRPQLHIVDGSIVDPNLDYQNELKKHHRLLFDPFRRGTHIFFEIETSGEASSRPHRTTVGQLCFIKWCIEHHVDRYVETHLDEIRAHMSASTKKEGPVKRRRELTRAPRKLVRGAVYDMMTIGH
jgi:hypothetical protein